ncbi:SCO4225 family membrane protein [Streptomyces sp. NPDC059491]|uniref:SCO4225 family membrane protein n=1 Tax=Streptomyces sp. NPDC059491 TaxID=3346850 RepID=UPI0036A1FCB0
MPTASHSPGLSRIRRVVALATGTWPARGYLAVFALSLTATFVFPDSPFAGSPLLLTAPLSFLCVFLPLDPGATLDGPADVAAIAVFALWLLLCALVNAAALGALDSKAGASAQAGAQQILPDAPGTAEAASSDCPAGLAGGRPGKVRALLAPAVDNWLARGYLAVVAATLGFFLCAAFVLPDPGFAGIWPLMATAPFSLLAMAVTAPIEFLSSTTWLSPLVFTLGMALSGLVNAVLLGRLARRLQAQRPCPATTP